MTASERPEALAVRDMYESDEVKAGEIISHGFLHYGYFDETNRGATLAEGSERLTRILMERTPITRGQRFCDIGSGVGVPAIMLAAERGCYVDGVTISSHQQRQASERAVAAGLSSHVQFIVADALQLPFQSESYDGGWFFESIFHMGHARALREVYRVLKASSILLIADLVLMETAAGHFSAYAGDRVHSCYIPKADYQHVLSEAGFELLELVDVTEQVSVPFPAKFRQAFETHRSEVSSYVQEDSFSKWLTLHEELSRNLGYVIVTARRLARNG
jgi:ubiquinone/menaquinone biosynthesis C-methylase UbiE